MFLEVLFKFEEIGLYKFVVEVIDKFGNMVKMISGNILC